MNLPLLLAAWFGASVPAALLVGAVLHADSRVRMPAVRPVALPSPR